MTMATTPTAPSAGVGATTPCSGTATGCCAICSARVKFLESTNQRYGFDDFDTPADFTDDHICIKKSDHTFVKVDINGALGTDLNFACDHSSVCTPAAPAATASFDLRLNAGAHNKRSTILRASCKCPAATLLGQIEVHVYKEKLIDVVVAKVQDSTSTGSLLGFTTADYAAHAGVINGKLKEAVVKFNITNFDPSNAVTNAPFDLDKNGELTFDIAKSGGAELAAIKRVMTGTGTRTRVAIVKSLISFFYLSAPAAVGDTTITVTATRTFRPTRAMRLGIGAGSEMITSTSSSGSTFTLSSPLTKAHPVGTPYEFPAAGWSTDPIIIQEGSSDLDTIKWTIPHEVGHSALNLADVDDDTNFMYFQQGASDHRLRYSPRTKKHERGTENQWELITR